MDASGTPAEFSVARVMVCVLAIRLLISAATTSVLSIIVTPHSAGYRLSQ